MMPVPRLFLIALLLLLLHLAEQLLFGIDELYELQHAVGAFLAWFGDRDRGTVLLVFATVMVVLLLCYGFMVGGTPRLIAAGFFGLEFIGESHHVLKTVIRGDYFPGAVSALALAILGGAILASAWREYSNASGSPREPMLTTVRV